MPLAAAVSWLSAGGCVLSSPPQHHQAGGTGEGQDQPSYTGGTTSGTDRAGRGNESGGSSEAIQGGDANQGGEPVSEGGAREADPPHAGSGTGGTSSGGSAAGSNPSGGSNSGSGGATATLDCQPRPATVCSPPTVNHGTNWPVSDSAQQYTVTAELVNDLGTGLTWQRKVAPLIASTCTGPAQFTAAEAACYCNALSLPGATSGWRLPSRSELLSIVSYGAGRPAINDSSFPGTVREAFWTSSTNGSSRWIVDFSSGGAQLVGLAGPYFVRCVRGGAAAPNPRYTAGTGALVGTVLDNGTHLRWQKAPLGPSTTTELAQQCESSNLAQLAWRLPHISELASLIDESRVGPALNLDFFEGGTGGDYASDSITLEGMVSALELSAGQSETFATDSPGTYARCVAR